MTDNFSNEPEVISAITSGNYILAIKELRKTRGIGLKEAKHLVDDYIDANGLRDQFKNQSGSGLGWAVFLALIMFGYYVFKNHL